MKKILLALAISAGLFSCENVLTPPAQNQNIIPETFSIELPSSISNEGVTASNTREAMIDSLDGENIYKHLNLFIHLGERSAKDVERVMQHIGELEIDKAMSFSFEGEDDQRVKNVEVQENVSFEDQEWDYLLTISDARAQDEGEEGRGIGFQLFWNVSPVKGIAIYRPHNLHRKRHEQATARMEEKDYRNLFHRVDYSEEETASYDKTMLIQVAGLPEQNDRFSMDGIRMFIGQKDDIVDIKGNSNHDKARFYTTDEGFSWSFVASANRTDNYSAAEVGLPPIAIDTDDREVLLKDYAIFNVLKEQMLTEHPNLPEDMVDQFLYNAQAPGFFSERGFIGAKALPDDKYSTLLDRMESLSPYNPTDVANATIDFYKE